MPAIGLVGRVWGDYLAKWFYVPVYVLVIAGDAVLAGELDVRRIGWFLLALLISVPPAVVLGQVVGLAIAFRWALTVRQQHIMRRWR